jgi:hypothetical protein
MEHSRCTFHTHRPPPIHKPRHLSHHGASSQDTRNLSRNPLLVPSPAKNLPLDHGIIRSCRQPGQAMRCVQEPAQEVLPGLRPRSLLPGLGSPQIRVRAEDLWSQQHCKSAPGKSITHLLILLTASLLVRHTTRQCTPISGLFLTSSKSIEH